ncbi:putative transcriptional regulator [Gottschalkia acidurici 9a]|uniref:Transcriptional regulator n=1 Tax=Gottschalkia acidurici (strain ATCC 7906 / DSM 604 / BCRC 14475 / CIP 104303 / KCTC 5404 / NCIMB 10678 / 9a) TaxID=1128398 RepID=K0B275_GOTA9|nr:helix-turn-helix transcriptional regulator [Gottschalkia acidurici]AFS79217.1 putative transcriptional regulator [Gottschalkia acidurici 9a]
MKERLLMLRKDLKLNQHDFGSRIEMSKASISALEKGLRDITDRTVKLICTEFSINEDWLRYGKGEMFIQADTFSLDDYAKQNNLSDLELDIVKAYINLNSDIRKDIITSLKAVFDNHSEIAVIKDEESDINKELEAYRLELEAEQRGRRKNENLT